jgi:hypothetical protein
MSLLTHADSVPWGESMRAELMSGHMPPWPVDSAAGRFRNVRALTARELNVLLTWATGGTPAGDAANGSTVPAVQRQWPLGAPDVVMEMPSAVTVAADVQDHIAEFTLPIAPLGRRALRAVDLLPGTPAVVRDATISIRTADGFTGAASAPGRPAVEHMLALWVPGDHPVPLDPGAAFVLADGAELVVRIHYRKTWEYERAALTDRSSVGIYFADEPATPLHAVSLAAGVTTIADPVQALAIYPAPELARGHVTVIATRPDGSRDELIAFRPRPGWTRRYWFAQPISLPRGTRLEVKAAFDEDALLPPGALPAPAPANPATVRLVLNVVPAG